MKTKNYTVNLPRHIVRFLGLYIKKKSSQRRARTPVVVAKIVPPRGRETEGGRDGRRAIRRCIGRRIE